MDRIRDLLAKNRQITGQTQNGRATNQNGRNTGNRMSAMDIGNGNQNTNFDPIGDLLAGFQQNEDEKSYDDDDTDDEQDDDDDDPMDIPDGFVSMKTTLEKVGLSRYTMTLMSNGIETTEQLLTMDTDMIGFIIPNVKDQHK